MAKIRPLGDKIVAKLINETEQTSGGIFIPDSAREKPQKAEVVAVGPGEKKDDKRIELDVKVGDTILFAKYGGTEIKLDGEEYKILCEKDVLGIIEQ
ncbi:MAG: co-chaperone GroES [Candidatus Gastranaerophilales bacterium]|nr:co-chaperone GroES [Candidatus Gastranaerophilales bacterium]